MVNTFSGKPKHQFKCEKCGFTLRTSGKKGIIRCPKCGFHPHDEIKEKIDNSYVFGD